MTVTLDHPVTHEAAAEWNHSCTSQCPNPCPAASSSLTQPVVGQPVTPVLGADS